MSTAESALLALRDLPPTEWSRALDALHDVPPIAEPERDDLA